MSASHYITRLIQLKEWATHLFDLISIIEIGMYAYATPFHKSKQENHIKNGLSLTLAYNNIIMVRKIQNFKHLQLTSCPKLLMSYVAINILCQCPILLKFILIIVTLDIPIIFKFIIKIKY